jgi:hypothetical protein
LVGFRVSHVAMSDHSLLLSVSFLTQSLAHSFSTYYLFIRLLLVFYCYYYILLHYHYYYLSHLISYIMLADAYGEKQYSAHILSLFLLSFIS